MILGLAQCQGNGVGKVIWSLFIRPPVVILTASGRAAVGDTCAVAYLECVSFWSLAPSPVGLPGKTTVPHPLLGPRPHSSFSSAQSGAIYFQSGENPSPFMFL